jgi:hypothetical protein
LSGSQLGPVAAGALAALAAVRGLHGVAAAGLAVLALGAGVAAGFLPVRNRTPAEWAPALGAFAVATAVARSHRRRRRRWPDAGGVPAARSRRFSGLELVRLEQASGEVAGAVRDLRTGRLTAVIRLPADGFAVLGATERARRVAAWSGLLVALAGRSGAIERLGWIERTLADSTSDLEHHAPGAPAAAAASYEELLVLEASGHYRHELLLACSLAPGAPSTPGPSSELGRFLGCCRDAGVAADRALSPDELAHVLTASTSPAAAGAGSSSPAGSAWPLAWPLAWDEEWSCLRTDGTWHATYWIAEWPRSAVGDDFLLPLLVGCSVRRSVALVMAPSSAGRALRRAEHARTGKVADLELRRRHGFALTAQLEEERRALERREEELAAGHAAFSYSGYVTVTADGRDELEPACRAVEQAAALARLELRRLYGMQREAFCCTLPSGRGCR